jgi:protein ImuB
MFACLCQPAVSGGLFEAAARPSGGRAAPASLEPLAREFSPRVEVHQPGLVTLDIAGLGRLLGTTAEIGAALRRAAADRGAHPHVAIAATRTAALLIALGRAGLTVVPAGEERAALAPLPVGLLCRLPVRDGRRAQEVSALVELLRRWGLKTLGDLAALPARPLSERLGQDGVMWQRLARGTDLHPLIATTLEEPIEQTLDLEWPVEGLEPLSFVLARVVEPIGERLAALDQAAVVLHVAFRLTSHEIDTRELQLPAPMRDAKVLRTLILLHLESHPLGAGVDRVTVRVDPAPARVTQFSLLARAQPVPETMATLLARLSALLGADRVGAPGLVDSHRPGAFAMEVFAAGNGQVVPAARRVGPPLPAARAGDAASTPVGESSCPRVALRRFRRPVPATVVAKDGRPVRVVTNRRGLEGGDVESSAGPWRTSGEWWRVADAPPGRVETRRADGVDGWDRDEWDVALSDGAVYRLYRDQVRHGWFIDGIVD